MGTGVCVYCSLLGREGKFPHEFAYGHPAAKHVFCGSVLSSYITGGVGDGGAGPPETLRFFELRLQGILSHLGSGWGVSPLRAPSALDSHRWDGESMLAACYFWDPLHEIQAS